jgi:SAM-dependent methyltransferase
MAILTEILKNLLIKLPPVKAIAKKRHVTGVNQSDEGIDTIFNLYNKHTDFINKDVIELGPGHTYGVACKIQKSGAKSISIIDIEKYIPDNVLMENSFLNYIIYKGNEMPVAEKSYDVALSYTVYEHLRNPEMTVRETFRILRNGGIAVHLIDLGDHLYYGSKGDPDKVLNCLRYSKRVWNLMSINRSIYVNRLRQSEWIELHKNAGFEIVYAEPIINNHIKNIFENGGVQYLSKFNPADRFASALLLIVRK